MLSVAFSSRGGRGSPAAAARSRGDASRGARLQGAQAWYLRRRGSAARRHVGSFHTRIKPTSPAFVGRFLTAGPPGQSGIAFYPSSLCVTLLSARHLVGMALVNLTASCEVSPCHVLTLERKELSPKEEKTYPTLPSYPVIRCQN